jgi:hypothetical protein
MDRSKLVDGPPGWQDAAAIACEALDGRPCPPVYWYGPAAMNCLDDSGFWYAGSCVWGVTGSDGVLIGYPWPDMRTSDTVIVHELAHWFIGGYGDPGHSDKKTWGDDPSNDRIPGTRVGDVNAELVTSGL